jgi:uncharacterized protein YbbC (DUF1343 family)/CubicO group peptidase (beta-lactamase class C family)
MRYLLGLAACAALAVPAPAAADPERLARIDDVVNDGIARGDCPGAVVLVLHRGKVVHRKAYGQRSVQPDAVPMTADTVFDLASLTKPVATSASIMLLVEDGKLRLDDSVAKYLPDFAAAGKENVTVEMLLLHVSGLIADNPVADYRDGKEKALERICKLEPQNPPGSRFVYSDVNFIVLGVLVEKLSGQPLDVFARRRVFEPLGMKETGFRPGEGLRRRAAPTEKRDGKWLVGEVHDPRAALLDGVAGHAGLFSTAADPAVFARMMLDGGRHDGKVFLKPESMRALTTPRPVPLAGGKRGLRTLGWDVDTSYSSQRGDLSRPGSGYGHTGFTGTSLWLDPDSDTAVIFLSNRVHPDGKGNVTRLRGRVASAVAAALRPDGVRTGIDVLEHDGFAALKGRRVGLVTNHTGLDRDGRATIDLLHKAEGVTLVALFSPEHGIRGAVDARVPDGKDEATGLPVYSLYGERRKPTKETLQGIDTLVFDIQDAGCRYYTYISTLGLVLEAAAEHKVRVVVLDRPNPLGGLEVEGPILDAGRESFVGWHPIPVRHGLTVGELALLFKAERKLDVDLQVIKMEGWRRGDLYDRTGLRWVNPSPNLRCLSAALLYPGVGLLETTNVSVGRGTDRPFEWVGAPWLDGRKFAGLLNEQELPGVRFVPARLTPNASTHKDKACDGVQIFVDDWSRFRPVRTGLAMAWALRKLYPEEWQADRYGVLLAHKATLDGLKAGKDWRDLEAAWRDDVEAFRKRRAAVLLYPE